MSKFTPTTKTCYEICELLAGNRDDKYVRTVYDPVCTHVIHNVYRYEVDNIKARIKQIGGKYIRVVKDNYGSMCSIRFALEITPQEAIAAKMEKEKEEKLQRAYESKVAEIEASILLNDAGATDPNAQKFFARMLVNGDLDPLLPFESYVFMDSPADKDEKRIIDIVNKANYGHDGCVGMVTGNRIGMVKLANQMNHAIADEDKRMRRRAACIKFGLNFLAKCFEKRT